MKQIVCLGVKRSQVQILSARLFFRISPSSFSAVGFLLGITDFSPGKPSSNGVLFAQDFRSPIAASRSPCLRFLWFKKPSSQ